MANLRGCLINDRIWHLQSLVFSLLYLIVILKKRGRRYGLADFPDFTMGLDCAKSSRWVTWRKAARAVVSCTLALPFCGIPHEFSCVLALDCPAQP